MNLLVAVIVILIIAAQCNKTANANRIGVKYLCPSIHPYLQDKQSSFFYRSVIKHLCCIYFYYSKFTEMIF